MSTLNPIIPLSLRKLNPWVKPKTVPTPRIDPTTIGLNPNVDLYIAPVRKADPRFLHIPPYS